MGGNVRSRWTPVYILIALGAILGFFQNCTSAVPFGDTDYYMSLVTSPEFPYEIRVDQVAYMSCSEQEDIPNDGTFFTFRVGAFRDGSGIRITEQYRDQIEKVDDEDVPYALQESDTIDNVRLQFGIRTVENLQLLYLAEDHGAEGLHGFDYFNFFPLLNDEALVNLLWYNKTGGFLRVYPNAQFIEDSRFAGELQFMQSQGMEYNLRNFLHDKGLLAVTFAESDKINPLGPGNFVTDSSQGTGSTNLQKNVFGVGLKPRFKQPSIVANPGFDMPPRVLSEIQEVRIDGRLQAGNLRPWTCPSSFQFTIVMPEHAEFTVDDVTVTRCRRQPDPVNPSPELQIIRQSLYGTDWYVDMENRCIVPKDSNIAEGSCYGRDSNTQQTHEVNYDSFAVDGCGFFNDKGLCPHYASICIRQ